jgi:hypothetical protein
MPPPRLRLRDGVPPSRAIEILDTLIASSGDVNHWMAPSCPAGVLRDQYLNWTEAVEMQLVTLTHDPEALHTLYTDRYWHIRAMADPRPVPLVATPR